MLVKKIYQEKKIELKSLNFFRKITFGHDVNFFIKKKRFSQEIGKKIVKKNNIY
jgi:hypothetical protein